MTAQPMPVAGPYRARAITYGVLCHGLFAIGVGTMIWAMFFGMSASFGRVALPWAFWVNALLLVQFPIGHSLLLTPMGAKMLRRLAPAAIGSRLATTSYAMVASLQVLLLFALWTPSGVVWWRAEGAAFYVLVALYTLAWLLLLKAIIDAGLALQTGFLGWWAVANERPPAFPPMPVTGLFALIRQPIYVAFALTVWTVPVWTPNQLTIAIILTAYCLTGPLLKEERFRQRFGKSFSAYAQRVPYWLPWPRPTGMRNDLSIYETDWWDGSTRWLRTLHNLVPARLAFFDPIVGDWSGKRVIDIGCGAGFMAEAMAGRGAMVVGVDPSEAAIAAAVRHGAAGDKRLQYRIGSGENLPAPDAAFDIAVCVDVLEHVEDLDKVIAEIARVLRPGGLFLFDTINRGALASFVIVTLGETVTRLLPRGAHDPALFIRPQDLKQKLEAAGFAVGRFAGMGPRGLNRRLDLTFGFLPTLAIQYLGYAVAPTRPHREVGPDNPATP